MSDAYIDRVVSCGYAINSDVNNVRKEFDDFHYEGRSEASLKEQSSIVTVFEARAGIIASYFVDLPNQEEIVGIFSIDMTNEIMGQVPGAIRHNGGANYVFADGHAKWLRPGALTQECDDTKPCFVQ